jgi:tetratricopeptide (TPR) repeat protein
MAGRVAALMLLLACASRTAHAEEPEQQARALNEQANIRFNLGEYDRAIELFKQAYALAPVPGFLFNIAQAYRLKRDCTQAALFYANFLRVDPETPSRAKVEQRIAEMRACVPPPPPPPPQKPVQRIPIGTLAAGVTLIAVGIAGIGAGAFYSADASAAASEVDVLRAQGGVWDAAAQASFARAEGGITAQAVLYPVGAAATITGVALVSWAASRRTRGLALVPRLDGAMVAWSGSF